jgi:AcrR family transcriptional regulator
LSVAAKIKVKDVDSRVEEGCEDEALPEGIAVTVEGQPVLDLRVRRRRLVQDEVAGIAVGLFLDRGYDAVSVEDIAAAAGMSERSFFRYFPTKEAVLRRYRRSLSERLVRTFKGRPADEPPVAALRSAYVETSHIAVGDRARVHALGRLLASAPDVWAKDMGETITDAAVAAELARRMGTTPDNLCPAVLAAAVSAAAATGWNRWVRSTGRQDPSAVVAGAIDMLGLSG